MSRKNELVTGEIYHVFSKSIAGFKIFNNRYNSARMVETIRYYQRENLSEKFSRFVEYKKIKKEQNYFYNFLQNKEKKVEIIAYCLMPTHLHLVLKQLKENGISTFMKTILNSYSRYFNTKLKRKGPLWEGRFKNVLVKTDEQLIHLTRYIHLNSVTAYLVDKPQNWEFSSYREYLGEVSSEDVICEYKEWLDIRPDSYKRFVNDEIGYQKSLAAIKDLIIE